MRATNAPASSASGQREQCVAIARMCAWAFGRAAALTDQSAASWSCPIGAARSRACQHRELQRIERAQPPRQSVASIARAGSPRWLSTKPIV